MINLNQNVGAFSVGKAKEPEVKMPVSTETTKRAKRGGRTARTVEPATPKRNGWVVPRVFSQTGVKPFDEVEWDRRTAEITDDTGRVIFKQENVEVPKSWSILATKVVVSKYFYGENGTSEREHSVRQLIHRVTRTMADWGNRDGYFATAKDSLGAHAAAVCP